MEEPIIIRGHKICDGARQLVRTGGGAELIVHNRDLVVFFRKTEHGAHEILPDAVKPCGADDKVAVSEVLHKVFAGKLGASVNRLRSCGIKFCQRSLGGSGENIIG